MVTWDSLAEYIYGSSVYGSSVYGSSVCEAGVKNANSGSWLGWDAWVNPDMEK